MVQTNDVRRISFCQREHYAKESESEPATISKKYARDDNNNNRELLFLRS